MATPWVQNVQLIQDFIDVVSAADTNRPLAQLVRRTQYLYEALTTAANGELLLVRNVSVAGPLPAGTPVWFDASDSRWKAGQAVVDVATGNDFGFAAPQSEVRGVVLVQHSPTTGDVALYGRVNGSHWGIDWEDVTDDESATPGRYYLSVDEGKITRSRNVLSVEIGTVDGGGDLVFTPNITGSLRSHLHLKFELEAVLAGDLDTPGWAAAADFVAAGITPPVGAVYGYVLGQNPDLAAKFPPQPIDNYFLAYNGVGVHKDAVVVNDDGIWWMNSTNTPANMGTHLYNTDEAVEYFEFWMTQLNTGSKLVTTLQTKDDANSLPIRIENLAEVLSTSGDLRIFLEQALKVIPLGTQSVADGYALKNVTGVSGVRGPVVDRVIAGPGVSVTGTEGTQSDGVHGTVQIASESAMLTLTKGVPVLAALDNAREDFYNQHLPVINLPTGRRSGVTFKVVVPDFLNGNWNLQLRFGVVSAGGISSSVEVDSLIVRPGSPVPASPTAEDAVTVVAPANELTLHETVAIGPVTAADIVLVTLKRDTPPGSDIMMASVVYDLTAGGV